MDHQCRRLIAVVSLGVSATGCYKQVNFSCPRTSQLFQFSDDSTRVGWSASLVSLLLAALQNIF